MQSGSFVRCNTPVIVQSNLRVTQYSAHKEMALYTLHAAHCTLHTAHCTLHTSGCTLHTSNCTLHTKHFKLHTTHSKSTGHTAEPATTLLRQKLPAGAQLSKHFCKLYPLHFTVHCALYCTLYTLLCTLYPLHCTLYTVLFNVLYNVLCLLYIHCPLFTVESSAVLDKWGNQPWQQDPSHDATITGKKCAVSSGQ